MPNVMVLRRSVHALEDELKSLGKSIEVHIYPGVDHAFFNDTRPQVTTRKPQQR
jgi:carboxymethylenebutenolidase